MKTIMLGYREGGNNGGPFNSHLRISQSRLSDKYQFVSLVLPKNSSGLRSIIAIIKMAIEIKRAKADIVQIPGLGLMGFFMAISCRLTKTKSILAIHGSSTQAIEFNKNILKKHLIRIIEILTLKMTTISFGVSNFVSTIDIIKRYARNYYGCIYNMTHITKPTKTRTEIRNELSINENSIVVISTGRITIEKGYETIADLIQLYKNNKNVKFVIAGDGDYRKTMEHRLESQIKSSQVHMLGYRNDVNDLLEGADIFIIASKHETLCMSLQEAGIAGVASVASDIGGIREIIDDGINGYLVPSFNPIDFKIRIDKLITDSRTRSQFAHNLKRKCQVRFSNSEIVKHLDYLYSSI